MKLETTTVNATPLISVLITAFNREQYIEAAIASVLKSSYTNFELIIVDDCSTDETPVIAKRYVEVDDRISVYRNEKNLGQFANRNKAASYAQGEFIKYVDSDDLIYSYTLELMVGFMKRFPKAAMGFCYQGTHPNQPFPFEVTPSQAFEQHFLQGGLMFVGPIGIIYSKKVFNEVNGFEEFGMPSDNHLSLKIASKHNTVAMPGDLFWWRIHANQVFSLDKKSRTGFLNNYTVVLNLIRKHSPLTPEINKSILSKQRKIFYINIFKLAFKYLKPLKALSILQQGNRLVK